MGSAVRRQLVVWNELREHASRRFRRCGTARRTSDRRCGRGSALSVTAHHGRLHVSTRSGIPSRRTRCLQPMDVGGVLRRRPQSTHRALPDAGCRYREFLDAAEGGQEPRCEGRHHFRPALRQQGIVGRGRSLLGRRRGSRTPDSHSRRTKARRLGRERRDSQSQKPGPRD